VSRSVEFLLVGGGMASAHCAAELRRRGTDGSILIVGREPDPPYERPPLSKDYLRGESERADAYVHERGWYDEHGVELLTGTSVMGLDPGERLAKLQGGEEVRFDRALLATGAMVNILRVEGARLDGVHYLRAFGNSDAIRDDVAGAEHVVLVGGSYIACEVAASLVAMGKRATIVMQEDEVFERSFGAEVGRFFGEVLRSHGVETHGGEDVVAFLGEGRVAGVRAASGLEVECDAIVVGAGVRPDTMLAGKAGLEVGDGIVCDATLATSAAGVYAAGDCCSWPSEVHGRRLRVEHWDVALQQGRHAAGSMLGDGRPYAELPYFFSDLADWAGMEYVGPAAGWDEVLFRGDPDSGEFSAWYLAGGRVAAALAVERSEDLIHARRLIEGGADVTGAREALADPGTELDGVG
jgi:3-phenylpropionate/trans-cinnamate dioxygenase ferredoxin reductase component